MSSGFDDFREPSARSCRRARARRVGLPSMSEKQAEAYLIARDALRRICRSSPFVVPTRDGALPRHERRRPPTSVRPDDCSLTGDRP